MNDMSVDARAGAMQSLFTRETLEPLKGASIHRRSNGLHIVVVSSGSLLVKVGRDEYFLADDSVLLIIGRQDYSFESLERTHVSVLSKFCQHMPEPRIRHIDLGILREAVERAAIGSVFIARFDDITLSYGASGAGPQSSRVCQHGQYGIFADTVVEASAGELLHDVVVIGCGPTGLSVAGSAIEQGLRTAILGDPMSFWIDHILPDPLRSPPVTSSIFIAGKEQSYTAFAGEHGLPQKGAIPFSSFIAYTQSVVQRYCRFIRPGLAVSLCRADDCWVVHTDSGGSLRSRNVVVSTGLKAMKHMPADAKAGGRVIHSSDFRRSLLRNTEIESVLVVGGGQSAIEIALQAASHGKHARMCLREKELIFRNLHSPGSFIYRKLAENSHRIVPRLPAFLKDKLLRFLLKGTVEPGLRDVVESARMSIIGNFHIDSIEERKGRAYVRSTEGQTISADLVVCATGYRWTLEKLPFMSAMGESLKTESGMPVLDEYFQASMPGLFFSGYGGMRRIGFKSQFIQGAKLITPKILAGIRGRAGN